MYSGFVDDRRAMLRMVGGDVRDVLQGVVTNDVTRLAPGKAIYSALLTPQGKYLFDFFLLDGGDGSVLVDAAADQAEALMARLRMYCLRRDAKLAAEEALKVALLWPSAEGADAPAIASEGAIITADPRVEALGWRIYAEDPAAILAEIGAEQASRADHDRMRVAHIVPEGGVELVPDDTFILEAGFERLHGIDFRKGCYVGQEVTARMKHRATLRRGLARVRVEGEAAPGTAITMDGRPAGTLFTVSDGEGLAELRLDRAGPGMEAGEARVDYEG